MHTYELITPQTHPDYRARIANMTEEIWPLFMLQSPIADQYEDGLPFDAWLRVHVRNGGEIIKTCHTAMEIGGSIAQWESWTGLRFPESGDYVIEGALSPVQMDVERDEGMYVEPNVWVHHLIT